MLRAVVAFVLALVLMVLVLSLLGAVGPLEILLAVVVALPIAILARRRTV